MVSNSIINLDILSFQFFEYLINLVAMPLSPREQMIPQKPLSLKPLLNRPGLASLGSGGGAAGGKTRDLDEREDEEMERNPSDFPFPSFLPTEQQLDKHRREVNRNLHTMTNAAKVEPVVSFKHPTMEFMRPLWRVDKYVEHQYIPKLDLMTVKDEYLKNPQTARGLDAKDERLQKDHSALPPWINTIRRVAQGCPQLGLPVEYEATPAKVLRAKQRLEEHQAKVAAEAAESLRQKRARVKAPSREAVVHSRGIGKPKTKKQEYDELLASREVIEQIRKQCITPSTEKHKSRTKEELSFQESIALAAKKDAEPTVRKKSIMISLPKIGVRMYQYTSVEDGGSQARSHSGDRPQPFTARL